MEQLVQVRCGWEKGVLYAAEHLGSEGGSVSVQQSWSPGGEPGQVQPEFWEHLILQGAAPNATQMALLGQNVFLVASPSIQLGLGCNTGESGSRERG